MYMNIDTYISYEEILPLRGEMTKEASSYNGLSQRQEQTRSIFYGLNVYVLSKLLLKF
jgi:hypothetical protein